MALDDPKERKADPNKPRVAPAPPPAPAHVQRATQTRGFDPKGGKLALEMGAGIAAILALGAFVIFAGGAIASWATPLVPKSFDRKLGAMSQEQLSLQSPTCKNPAAQEYVAAIGQRILQPMGKLPFDFQFRVADTSEVNAFALPGGYVTVNWGLLQEAKSGEEVAGVLGHEIQHALLRHGTKRMLRQLGSGAIMMLVFGGSDVQSLGYLAGQLAGLSYDRGEESEADLRGVDLLVRAKIDPRGLATFFERLSKDALRPPELLSTHPDPGERAQLVKQASLTGQFLPLPPPLGLSCN